MTVIFWLIIQVSGWNTSSAGDTRPSPSSLLRTGRRTVAVGARFNATVMMAAAPDSDVTGVPGASRLNPGSSSRLVTLTSTPSSPW